jgi:hypothetical protein
MTLKGTINKLGRTGTYGWIDRKTVIHLDGQARPIDGGKDIYVHQDDCAAKLVVGADVTFNLAIDDSKRSSFYRASCVEQFVPQKHLELHIDATTIDNPSVPLRWCFTPEMHRRMIEGVKKGYTYAMLLIIKNQDDGHGYREKREIKSATQPFSYVAFPRAGKWDVDMVLYENTSFEPGRNNEADLVRTLSKSFLDKAGNGTRSWFERSFPSLQLGGLKAEDVLKNRKAGHASPIAASGVVVEIPEGIFAPEPSPAVKAFVNRFFRTKPYDECDHRRRFMIMTLGFGWVPWIGIELIGRTLHLGAALFQLLFALRGSWGNVLWSFRPSVRFTQHLDLPEWGADDNQLDQACVRPWNSKIGFFLTPGFLTVGALFLTGATLIILWIVRGIISLFSSVQNVGDSSVSEEFLWAGLAIFCVTFIYRLLVKALVRMRVKHQESQEVREKAAESKAAAESERRRQSALKSAEIRAAKLERVAPSLICGGDVVHEVSLKAIPTELKTFRMMFDHLKRKVCRPFG